MSQLGDFLERFYGPKETFGSVRGSIRHTKLSPLPGNLHSGRPAIGRRRRDNKAVEQEVEELAFWARMPDMARIETTMVTKGQSKTGIEVVNGTQSWTRRADGTIEKSTPRRTARGKNCLPTEFQRHFDRRLLRECFAALTLETIGTCRVADRDCLKLRAQQVPGIQLWPHWLTWDATAFEFAADLERAVLLSIVGKIDGQSIESHEVLDVTFDEQIDDSYFTYQPSPNESVRPATPVFERITLEAACRRAPFTLLIPARLPENQRQLGDITYHPARANSPSDDQVSIRYSSATGSDHFWIEQRARPRADMQNELEWAEVEKNGRKFQLSDPSPQEGLRIIAFQHIGTYVYIVSDLPTEALLDIAISMAPASSSGAVL